MKNTSILLLIFTALSSLTYAQEYSTKYGEISKSEIELTQYAPDTAAAAIVLFDIGKSYFLRSDDGGFDVIFERTTRIKILSEAGIEWAKTEIPFYQEGGIYEKVQDLEGTTYNFEDGKLNKTPLDPKNAYTEKQNEYWNLMKFAMPNVKVGSIIECKYKINSQYIFNLRDWDFQQKIPVIYSEYKVLTIPFYEYTWLLQGRSKFDEQYTKKTTGLPNNYGGVEYQELINSFVLKNLPAFNDEEYITSMNDYIIRIDFQLSRINRLDGAVINVIKTWEDLTKDYLKDPDFGKYVSASKSLTPKLIAKESLTNTSDLEKFNLVINTLKQTLSWDENYARSATKPAKKVLELKTGNCAELNLMAVGMLNGVGIEAYPVLMSTRQHGKIKTDYPFTHFLNYVIVAAKIDSAYVLTDVTEINSLNNRIPVRCINDKGLLVKKGKDEWVGLEFKFPSETITEINYQNLADSSATAKISISANEYHALRFRNKYGDDKDNLIKKISSDYTTLIDSSVRAENMKEVEKPYKLSYAVKAQPEMINHKLYVAPFLKEVITENHLKQKNRTYPIDMVYPDKYTYKANIAIPEGYKVDYLPLNQSINNKLFSLSYSTLVEGDSITVNFSYYFKYNEYPATDYARVKFYFDEIIKKGNDKIVLVPVDEKTN